MMQENTKNFFYLEFYISLALEYIKHSILNISIFLITFYLKNNLYDIERNICKHVIQLKCIALAFLNVY